MTPTIEMNDETSYIELRFAPSMRLVTLVRRFVGSFFEAVLTQPAPSGGMAITVHELLENAVKFSRDGDAFIRVAISNGDTKAVTVETRNHANATELGSLEQIFNELRTAPSPLEFYMARMERALGGPRSQLGIARVYAEAGMKLDYSVRDNLVRIIATRSLEEKPS